MIDASNWKEFKVRDVLKVEQTKSVVSKSDLVDGDIPYVTRTVSDNGYTRFCGNKDKVNEGNCITIGAETGVAFYQPNDFVAGNKVYRLSREGLGEKEYLYLAGVLNKQTGNYSYSNARIPEKIKAETMILPVTPDGMPDWEYMERYIAELEEERVAELEEERVAELEAYLIATGLNDYELTEEDKATLSLSAKSASYENGYSEDFCGIWWKEFKIGNLFKCDKGDVDLQQKDINGKGEIFINSGETNLGIKGRTDRKAKILPANTITIDFWGFAYYREFRYKLATHNHVFSLSGDVIKNKEVGLFLVSMMSKLRTMFSYNNMATWTKLKDITIQLPVFSDGTPDFEYMEKYIRATEKVVIKDVVEWKDIEIKTLRKINTLSTNNKEGNNEYKI